MTATPFLHFGMYSQKFSIQDSISVWEFFVDGRRLNLLDLSSKNADHIVEPVIIYSSNKQSGEMYENSIKRILNKAHIPNNRNSFDPTISQVAFDKWYKYRVSNILKRDVKSIQVYYDLYSVEGSNFKKAKTKLLYAIN